MITQADVENMKRDKRLVEIAKRIGCSVDEAVSRFIRAAGIVVRKNDEKLV